MQQYPWQSLLLDDELFLPQIFSAYRWHQWRALD